MPMTYGFWDWNFKLGTRWCLDNQQRISPETVTHIFICSISKLLIFRIF